MLMASLLILAGAFRLFQNIFNNTCLPKEYCKNKWIPSLSSNNFRFNYTNHFGISFLSIEYTPLRFSLALCDILIQINFIKKMLYRFILWQERYIHSLFLHTFKLIINISIQLNILY